MNSVKTPLCDEHTYSKIFMEYSKTLYHFLYYKCGNEDLAKDITQESFLKLWANCAKVSLETAKGYVFRTANNQLLNEYDHRKVQLKLQQIKRDEKNIESPAFLLEEKEFRHSLELAISELPEKQRVVFLLSRVDKKTYKEIAEILGISKQAVEKRMYNSLNTLRKLSEKIR